MSTGTLFRRADYDSEGMPTDRQHLDDRQLDAILERLDRLCDEVHALNRRLDTNDQLQRIVAELGSLNESLQALAYAALGSQGPQVRRRRSA
jgi:hypothetical protein